jgi:hypothetical protein
MPPRPIRLFVNPVLKATYDAQRVAVCRLSSGEGRAQTTPGQASRTAIENSTLVDDTVRRIQSGLFLPHRGIRFPENPCTTCPFIGLCLDKPDLIEAGLVRKPGVDLGLFDELVY